ncbi:Adenylate kinase [hydrothermal vent metagenome]|uniref:Adenylate kinase n=1 Tax=hydrothermal vent metagenome TaxID=652676 RepID=A0A3B1D8W1_9ZZZZ
MRIVLLGPPGAGKGSLAKVLQEALDLSHISTGDILREEMKKGSFIGQEAKAYIEKGELVPDEVVIRLIENKLSEETEEIMQNKGYMLDGFPRTKQQAESLDQILKNIEQPLDCVVYLDATLPVIIARLTGRRVCKTCGAIFHIKNKPPQKEDICDSCGGEIYQRADDNEETIKNRMDVYLENTQPMVDYYKEQEKLEKIDGDAETHELGRILLKKFNEEEKFNQH